MNAFVDYEMIKEVAIKHTYGSENACHTRLLKTTTQLAFACSKSVMKHQGNVGNLFKVSSGVFIVNSEQVSHIIRMFPL